MKIIEELLKKYFEVDSVDPDIIRNELEAKKDLDPGTAGLLRSLINALQSPAAFENIISVILDRVQKNEILGKYYIDALTKCNTNFFAAPRQDEQVNLADLPHLDSFFLTFINESQHASDIVKIIWDDDNFNEPYQAYIEIDSKLLGIDATNISLTPVNDKAQEKINLAQAIIYCMETIENFDQNITELLRIKTKNSILIISSPNSELLNYALQQYGKFKRQFLVVTFTSSNPESLIHVAYDQYRLNDALLQNSGIKTARP